MSNFGDVTKKKFFSIIRENKDIIFLTDTRLNSTGNLGPYLSLLKLAKTRGYKLISNSNTSSRGVCILIKESRKIEILGEEKDDVGNILLIKTKIRTTTYILGAVYGPNRNEDIGTYETLTNMLCNCNCRNIILGGDWNCTWDVSPAEDNLDIINMNNIPSRQRSNKVHEICNEFALTDPFRVLFPDKKEFTYFPAAEGQLNRSRLDFFLVSNNLCEKISNCFISNSLITELFDHKAIEMEFKGVLHPKNMSVQNKNLDRWEIKVMVRTEALECYLQHANIGEGLLLEQRDEILQQIGNIHVLMRDYNNRMKDFIDGEILVDNIDIEGAKQRINLELENLPAIEWAQSLELNSNAEFFFEALCNCMRNAAIKEQSRIFKIESKLEKNLNREIENLKLLGGNNNVQIIELEQRLSNLIDRKLKEEVKQHKRYEIICEEKITPEFINIIRCTRNEESLSLISNDDGTPFLDNLERENYIKNVYKDIFKEPDDIRQHDTNIEDFLGNVNEKEMLRNSKLSEAEKLSLDSPLTIEELDISVKKSKKKSAPGADGISNAFIKTFWDIFRIPLFKLATYCYDRNELTSSFRCANIKLIPKKGNLSLLKNWRPISLLNCFYKIISRAMGNRLKKVMDKLTPIGQKGHSKTRRCQEVLINLIESIEQCKRTNKRGAVLSLDIKKAFDCVSHRFVEKTLRFFNFGEVMIKWLLLLSTKRTACIVLEDNKVSEVFNLERGNAQGDIISPFIFNLCYQILLFKIEYDDRILGPDDNAAENLIQGDNQVTVKMPKVVAMADDANCILKLCVNTLVQVKNSLEEYRLISGFECNIDKTVLMPIGLEGGINEDIRNLGFSIQEKIKVVGMDLSNRLNDFQKEVDSMSEKLKKIVREFSRFGLSLPGRINVAKTFLYSQLNYLGSFLPLGKNQCERLNYIIGQFVAGKINVSQKRIFSAIEIGGLGLFEVYCFLQSQRCSWYRYLNTIDDYWKRLIAVKSVRENPFKCRSSDIREYPVCHGIVLAYETFVHNCISSEKTFLGSRILDNKNIPTGTRGFRSFNPEFFGETYELNKDVILGLTPLQILGVNGNQNYVNFRLQTNANIGWDRFNSMKRGLELKLRRFEGGYSPLGLNAVERAFMLGKKGSRVFRKIINGEEQNYIPHNIQKFAETTECFIGLEKAQKLNSLWGNCFLDNGTRTFIFKLHNNTLGVNNRVAKFVRGHSAMCTFCEMTGNEDDNQESVLHLFWSCEHVEGVVLGIFRIILNYNENLLLNRGSFFGGFESDNETKNAFLLFFISWIKRFIWECRLKKTLPTLENGRMYVMDKIRATFDNNKTFRGIVENSDLDIRF